MERSTHKEQVSEAGGTRPKQETRRKKTRNSCFAQRSDRPTQCVAREWLGQLYEHEGKKDWPWRSTAQPWRKIRTARALAMLCTICRNDRDVALRSFDRARPLLPTQLR